MRNLVKIASALAVLMMIGCVSTQKESNGVETSHRFDLNKDHLFTFFDSKTDVDDIHTIAGLATVLADKRFNQISYHAVAGTYGTQDGLYVPSNELFDMAFNDNWSDAHTDWKKALSKATQLAEKTLSQGGDIWIAEAGQSDFSADLVRNLKKNNPELNTKTRINIIQHADWNEQVTAVQNLAYVKANTNYVKIPDGNSHGNGTPGFVSHKNTIPASVYHNKKLGPIWYKARKIANKYNAVEGRYFNPFIAHGGLDFSDLSEVCWILGIEDIYGTTEFFERVAND